MALGGNSPKIKKSGFLSSAIWPSLQKKHYNILINNHSNNSRVLYAGFLSSATSYITWPSTTKTALMD